MNARLLGVSAGVVVLAIIGLPVRAVATLQQAAAQTQSASQNPPGFDEALAQGNDLLQQGKFDDALKQFKRANEMKKGASAQSLWGMAQVYLVTGESKKALETCDRVVQAGDDRQTCAFALNQKGQMLYGEARQRRDRKKFAEAEAAFRKALEAWPELHIAHFNLGSALMSQEQDSDGVEQMQVYLERDPEGQSARAARRMIENPKRARENFAPDFAFTTMDGSRLNSDELRGKVIVLDFWATWCGPCVQSLDEVDRLARQYADRGVVLISISADTDADQWRRFVGNNNMSWPQLLDGRRVMQKAFAVAAIPTYFVIDQEGILREQVVGGGQFHKVVGAVNDCLKKGR